MLVETIVNLEKDIKKLIEEKFNLKEQNVIHKIIVSF